ncbi:MAG: phage Gp37/Gp68 family protein [Reyranella sp.]|nr:phage Gp37/Gp68 family protein [Reyranella sp.]
MGERTTIAWTDHTFNPVWGCLKVGPGCDYCYAEVWAARFFDGLWDGKFREFGPIRLGQKHTCLDCGGEIDGVALLHYVEGYQAAGGDPHDVYPGFRAELPR